MVLIISQNNSGGICLGQKNRQYVASWLIFRFDLLKNGLMHIFLQDIIHSELKIGLESGIGEEMS